MMAGSRVDDSHEILFCADEAALLDGLTRFIATALNQGNPAIVWATESHREVLLERLRGRGIGIEDAIQRGTYIAPDVTETADGDRIVVMLRGLSEAASQSGTQQPRVAVCGERAGRLWAEGKTDTALMLEQFFNKLAKRHDMDILCVYPLPKPEDYKSAFGRLCAEHNSFSVGWSGS